MPTLTLNAAAKVNLYLHVTGKREDGYHLLDSLVVFPRDIHDTLSFKPAERFCLTIDGPFAHALNHDPSNLVTKAAESIAKEAGRPAAIAIHLTKNIPLGSGLGGGSTDAASTILGLQEYWDIKIPEERLQHILVSLGADVPVCYANHPCRFQGIGEKISDRIELPPLYILLIWPGKPSFTKNVFAQYKPRTSAVLPETLPSLRERDDFLRFLNDTRNDLEDPATNLCAEIGQARDFIRSQEGCLFSRMTGSGATVFGLFESPELCEAAQKRVPAGWWSRLSPL